MSLGVAPAHGADTGTDAPVRIDAPAKINLFLHVVGRRPDGYHLLESLVAFTEVGDTLEFWPQDAVSLETVGPFADALALEDMATGGIAAGALHDQPHGLENLILKAARRLAQLTGSHAGAHIRLTKNLPVAAGIGGGSADAAAALTGLARLWGVSVPRKELMNVAEELGADVPVCLDGRPSLVTGIGEGLTPLGGLPALPIVLVNPRRPVSTGACFRAVAGGYSQPGAADPDSFADCCGDAGALNALLADRGNDLMAPAREVEPAVASVLDALAAAPGAILTRMSGSGATCFALFETAVAADLASDRLSCRHSDWWVASTVLRTEAAALPPCSD